MPQTKAGGAKVRAAHYARYGKDYYRHIGAMGGKVSAGTDYQKGGPKAIGFAKYPDLARIAGAKGGRISKRRPGPNSKKASPIPTLSVSMAEQEQLSELAQALQDETNVISY